MSAMFLPPRYRVSVPAFLAAFSSAARSSRPRNSCSVKSASLRKWRPARAVGTVAMGRSRDAGTGSLEFYTSSRISMRPGGRSGPAARPRSRHRVPFHRAAHAARAAAGPAQFAAADLYHLDALLAQVRVGGGVALVGDHHDGLEGQHVAAVVPLLALRGVHVLGGGQHPDLAEAQRG